MGPPRHGPPMFQPPGPMMRPPGVRGPPGFNRMPGPMDRMRPPMPGGYHHPRPMGGRGGQRKARAQRSKSKDGDKKTGKSQQTEKNPGLVPVVAVVGGCPSLVTKMTNVRFLLHNKQSCSLYFLHRKQYRFAWLRLFTILDHNVSHAYSHNALWHFLLQWQGTSSFVHDRGLYL